MKQLISFIILVALLVYTAKPTITLKQFSVHFESPALAIGLAFLFVGLSVYAYHFDCRGYKRCTDELKNEIEIVAKLKEKYENGLK